MIAEGTLCQVVCYHLSEYPMESDKAKAYLPNILSFTRITLTVPICLAFYYLPTEWGHYVAAILFLLASLTDCVDGHCARTFKTVSPFGKFIDQFADKVLIVCCLIVLIENWHNIWIHLIGATILLREVWVLTIRMKAMIAERNWMSNKVEVISSGKLKTCSQMLTLFLFFVFPQDRSDYGWIILPFITIAFVMSLVSAASILYQYKR